MPRNDKKYVHKNLGRIVLFWVVAFPSPMLAQTDHGWEWLNPYPQGNIINDVAILSSHKMIAVGNNGTMLVSSNGGKTWSNNSNPSPPPRLSGKSAR
jgi:photosystem II stability/assembly factor-like uncharacterized protein